jgi:hypothetical protein
MEDVGEEAELESDGSNLHSSNSYISVESSCSILEGLISESPQTPNL